MMALFSWSRSDGYGFRGSVCAISNATKKRRIAADGCRRIAVCSDFVPCSTAEPFYAISYSAKKRATPAGKLLALQAVCSPIQVWLVSQQCKRRGWFCVISYGTKKAPTNRSLELMMGLEPMTCWLRINCSTDWATLAKGASEFCYIIITYKIRFVNIKMKFF